MRAPIVSRARHAGRAALTGIALCAALALACGEGGPGEEAPAGEEAETSAAEPAPAATGDDPLPDSDQSEIAVIEIDGFGTVKLGFLTDKAPETVKNFKKLATDGFYDGITFHRVIPGFMVQGGDPNTKDRDPRNDGTGGPGYQIDAEFNDTPHVRGVVSMARTSNPNSAGSQFFIVHQKSKHLDNQYTAFATVIEGMDVVDRIANVPTDKYGRHGPRDRPMDNVVMTSVKIVAP